MSALTPTELRTLADLAEKFAGLAIDLAKACDRAPPPRPSPTDFVNLLTEAIDCEIIGDAWIALREDALAIVKEKSR